MSYRPVYCVVFVALLLIAGVSCGLYDYDDAYDYYVDGNYDESLEVFVGDLGKTDGGFVETVAGESRLLNGTFAEPGEFPYWVGLINSLMQSCGGAIISKKHILTAATCFRAVPSMNILAGCVSHISPNCVTHTFESIEFHPNFNSNTRENDVAIISIVGEFQLNEFVQIIDISPTAVGLNTPAVALGWSAWTADLLWFDVSVENCVTTLFPTVMCTLPQILFYGDLGSPLVSNGMVIGIGLYVGMNDDQHTAINSYVEWINNIIAI